MNIHLDIIIRRYPQVRSFIRSSVCFYIAKYNGRNLASLYLQGMERSFFLIPEGHYSGRIVFSAAWHYPIICIYTRGIYQSILYRCNASYNGIDPINIGLNSTQSNSISGCDKAVYLIETFLKSYEIESVDVEICSK